MTLRSTRSEFVRKALLALAPAVLLLATASSASAATKFDSIMQDDRLFANPATQAESLDTADGLGVDVIHTIVGWRGLAPKPIRSRAASTPPTPATTTRTAGTASTTWCAAHRRAASTS
jgi:hypothetical protein